MGEYNDDSILEMLEIFRWSLYNAIKEDAKEKERSLLEEACQKPIYEPFVEEYLIAGCDMTEVNPINLILCYKSHEYLCQRNYLGIFFSVER